MKGATDSFDGATQPETGGVGWRKLLRFALTVLVPAAVLFVAAGTLAWPMAWAYLGVYLVVVIGGRALMFRANPDLFRERAAYAEHKDVPSWDRRIMPLAAIYGPFAMMVVAGLNRRFGWPPVLPPWLQVAALLTMVLGMVLGTWALVANRYFSAVVRIQRERGHTVVTAGPYRYVRHPGYAGGIVANLATPLALGSLWALVPAALVVALTVLRTALEDRKLQDELPGYEAYARRVRYRLLPGVW